MHSLSDIQLLFVTSQAAPSSVTCTSALEPSSIDPNLVTSSSSPHNKFSSSISHVIPSSTCYTNPSFSYTNVPPPATTLHISPLSTELHLILGFAKENRPPLTAIEDLVSPAVTSDAEPRPPVFQIPNAAPSSQESPTSSEVDPGSLSSTSDDVPAPSEADGPSSSAFSHASVSTTEP